MSHQRLLIKASFVSLQQLKTNTLKHCAINPPSIKARSLVRVRDQYTAVSPQTASISPFLLCAAALARRSKWNKFKRKWIRFFGTKRTCKQLFSNVPLENRSVVSAMDTYRLMKHCGQGAYKNPNISTIASINASKQKSYILGENRLTRVTQGWWSALS